MKPWANLIKGRLGDHCAWRTLQNSSHQEFSSFKLLEMYFSRVALSGRRNYFSICVSLMKNPGGVIAEQHTLEAVSKSQPLKHNGERALTRAIHCQIRPAITVSCGIPVILAMQLALKCFRHLRTLSVRSQAWCPCINRFNAEPYAHIFSNQGFWEYNKNLIQLEGNN